MTKQAIVRRAGSVVRKAPNGRMSTERHGGRGVARVDLHAVELHMRVSGRDAYGRERYLRERISRR